ncbi:hypothetical protein ACE1SV_62100 [Streptomyces sennicomposti]
MGGDVGEEVLLVGVEEGPAALLMSEPLAGCGVAGIGPGVVVGALPQDRPGRVPPGVDQGECLLGGGGAAAFLREFALSVEPFAEGEAVVDGLDRSYLEAFCVAASSGRAEAATAASMPIWVRRRCCSGWRAG